MVNTTENEKSNFVKFLPQNRSADVITKWNPVIMSYNVLRIF